MKPLTRRQIFGYTVGDLGINLNFQLIGFYLAVIANYVTMLLSNGLMFWNYWLAPAQDAWLQRPAVLAGLNAFIILSREATDEFTDHLYVCSEKVNKQLELS